MKIFGGPAWQVQREALVAALKEQFDVDWPEVETVPRARVLAGLTTVSDWIGSGEFFKNPNAPWKEQIGPALDSAGFIPPVYKLGLSFEQVFKFPPRPVQQQLIEQAVTPGVYVLEAPMGLGKTEAALYAAYRASEMGQSSGIYFALPTQLTSNKIYERFSDFLGNVLAEECPHRSLLLHSNAWLLDTDMGEDGSPGGSWFHHIKRGLLAPFAVGTIDQALMAAMNVKHGFVRAFGLAGKVVILDEVHTYDAYTGSILDALIELLRSLHCTVIVLSATLHRERREQLLDFQTGSDAYPLITAVPNAGAASEVSAPVAESQQVSVRLMEQEHDAIESALRRAEQGQQVLWIENTVRDAQNRYLDLAARADESGALCGLLHSRYTPDDRRTIEDHWVNQFGKTGWKDRAGQGRILVGTQVLEQSLDIDADFMVSRFAPTDLLLQRLGRLWRHEDTPRSGSAECEVWLLAPPIEKAISTPEKAFGRSAFVYSPYILCRSLEVWQYLDSVSLPGDIRRMIDQTYATREEDSSMARWLADLDHGTRSRTGRIALRQLARVVLANVGNTLPESKAETRYSDAEKCDVLLLRHIALLSQEGVVRLTLLNGDQCVLPMQRHSLTRGQWRRLSACLMRQIVSVPVQEAPLQLPLDTLKRIGLHHCLYLGNPIYEEAVLRVALVEMTGSLMGVQGAPLHDKYKLTYRDDLGYRVSQDKAH